MTRPADTPTELLPRARPEVELDLEGRRAMFEVLGRLSGRTETLKVGRYELGRRLGQGGCGAVFEAHDPKLDRGVAIKVVLPTAPAATEASERLVREAQALAKLGHPNIVEVFDVGVDMLELGREGRPRRGVYIVMERIDGPTLVDWQADLVRSADDILDAYVQAALGLAAAHAVGVIHRDFKPANVMRTSDGRVKVLDFGLAREDVALASEATTGPSSTSEESSLDSLTRTGTVMGTPRYMAPEQHAAQIATAAADQYALCVALWEALARRPAFAGPTLTDLADAKRRGAPPRPETGAITRAIHAVLARGLAPDPKKRYPSLSALVVALLRARHRRRRWPLVMLSAGAAAAAVLAVSRPEPLPPQCDAEPPAWINDGFAEHVAILPPGAPPRLERFARRWSAARTLVCDPDADLRLPTRAEQAACLERARVVFETAAHELTLPASAEASTRRAKRQLWGLPSPQRCTGEDVSSYFARTSEEEAELDAIQSRMVELLKSPPDPAQVDAFIGRSIARAEALHDHGIATGLLTLHARITHQGGDYEAAARMDTEAAWRCEAADDPLLAAEHLSNAAASLTSAGAPPAEVDRLIAQALEMAEAAGNPTEIAVELGGARAYVASSRGDFDSALELAYEVMRRAEADPSPGVRATMTRALDLAATAHINRGESYLALPLQRRALEMSRPDDRHGNEKIAFIHRGMAFAAFQSGEPELALESELASLALLGEVYAPDHPGLLWDVAFYGFMLAERGQVDEGIAHMEHARRVLLQAPRAPELASVLANLATAWVAAGRFEEAERDGQEAIERFTEQFGPASPQVAAVQQTVAEARLAQGDLPGARQALAAARDAMQAFGDPGPGHALVSARIHMAEGAWDVARAELLVALEGLGPAQLDQSSVGGRGLVYALLARIFAEQGDLDAARVMARFADPLLLRGGQVHRSHRDEIAAWLDGT